MCRMARAMRSPTAVSAARREAFDPPGAGTAAAPSKRRVMSASWDNGMPAQAYLKRGSILAALRRPERGRILMESGQASLPRGEGVGRVALERRVRVHEAFRYFP